MTVAVSNSVDEFKFKVSNGIALGLSLACIVASAQEITNM